MEKSLARLAYDVLRKTQARARKESGRLRGNDGNAIPDNKSKKGLLPTTKKKVKSGGYNLGGSRAATKQSIVEEIKGTGGSGPGQAGQPGQTTRRRVQGISLSLSERISDLSFETVEKVVALISNWSWWAGLSEDEQERHIRASAKYYGF